MLFLGTIHDPRKGWKQPDYCSLFINDQVYQAVSDIRLDCSLPDLKVRGMNRAWPLSQGWTGVGIKAGAQCVDCKRVVPAVRDPSFKRYNWRYADVIRPSANHLRCLNCFLVMQRKGIGRTPSQEARRVMRANAYPTPGQCEYPGCTSTDKPKFSVKEGHRKYYCTLHYSRAKYGIRMDIVGPRRGTHPSPGRCEVPGCTSAGRLKLYAGEGHDKYYCNAHYTRARTGKSMVASVAPRTRGKSVRPNPSVCEHRGCDRTTKVQ